MKKKTIIIILIVLVVISGAAGYGYYKYYFYKDDIDVISLVPENAILVYEINNTINDWNELQNKSLWASLGAVSVFSQINNTLIELDSITGKEGNLDKVFQNNALCISLHQTSKESFGSVFYFKIKDLEGYDILDKVLKSYKKDSNIIIDARTYLGEKIFEVRNLTTKKTFSYILYKDHLAGSFYPVLLEDVIRNIETDETTTFKERNSSLFNIAGTFREDETLYVNAKKINALVSIFSGKNKINDALINFTEASKLNLDIKDDEIYLSGYSFIGNTDNEFYLGTFKGQKPSKINQINNFIPNRTSTLLHATFNNGTLWYSNLSSFWNKKVPAQEKNHQQLKQNFQLDPTRFFKWMGGEIALATLQSMDVSNTDKILIIKTNDIQEAFNQLNKLASNADRASGDSLFIENFSGKDIRQLNIKEFPSHLLGNHYSGFPTSYFTTWGNYIIMGNSLQVMKGTIADIEADNVWGKSVAMNQYFENNIGDANISYITNLNRGWNTLIHHLNENWSGEFQVNKDIIKNFPMMSLQFSDNNGQFYTNIHVKHQNTVKKDGESQDFNIAAKLAVGAPIITKPFFIKNANGKNLNVMFQDSLFNLYKVSTEGELLWKDSIGEKIAGEIYQIDYLKNGELQYIFATPSALHILSNDGSYINNNFPHYLDNAVEYLTVIDYDNSKNYRFMLAATNGAVYMLDKQLEALEGWNPKNLNSKPAAAPVHARIRGKDCLISLQENGVLNAMNRRGESLPGFPVNLQGIFRNDVFIETGPTFSQTYLTTISEKGELVKLNLEGKTVRREQFYRPSKETRFVLCVDEYGRNYVIARQELGILTLMDVKGEVILEKDYITSGALEIQYFNAGIEREIYAVTDRIQEFTYLYDHKGNLINSRPIDSGHKIALNYMEASGSYEVISNFNTRFTNINFRR